MKKVALPLLFAVAIFGFSGCSGLIYGLYGMKMPKPVDEQMVVRYATRYKIPPADSYLLDTSYVSWLLNHDTAIYKWEINNHYQPLQAMYYDRAGKLVSFQVNCYTGGFPNLQWERDSIFSTFPPCAQTKIDSLVTLDKLNTFIRPVGISKPINPKEYDFLVVVEWNRFMGRQSRRFIRIVQHNSLLAKEVNFRIIYVNTDNNFAFARME